MSKDMVVAFFLGTLSGLALYAVIFLLVNQ